MSGRESRVDGGQLDEVRTETWRVKGMSCSVVINKRGEGGGNDVHCILDRYRKCLQLRLIISYL